MSSLRFVVCVLGGALLFYAGTAAGQRADSIGRQATPAAAPTLPYLDRHGYHAVQLGPWRLKAPATLVSRAEVNSKAIAALPAGTSLRALKVEILTVRPAVCEAVRDGTLAITQWVSPAGRQNTREIQAPIRRGDRVYELAYYEEGTCSIWIRGATGLAECGMNGLAGGAPLCRYAGADKPVTDVWAYVATSNGQRGWLRNPQATGMSRHD